MKRTRVAAYGLLVDDNRILLCRISAALPHLAGQWTLPGGGIEFGEDPVDAMVREVSEETGLLVRAGVLATVNSIHRQNDEHEFHGIRIVYHAQILGGTLAHEVDGTTDKCAWWQIEQARSLPLVDLANLGLALAFQELPSIETER